MSFTTRFSSARRPLARHPIAWLVAGALATAGAPAFAQVAGGNAYELQVNISVAGLINLDVDPIKQVTTAPQADAYALQGQLLDWSVGNAVASVSAGVLQSALQWEPGAGQFVAGADASTANVSVSAVSLLGAALLEVTANQIHSMVLISGQCPVNPKSGGAQTNDLGDVVADMLYGNGFDAPSLKTVNTIEVPGLTIKILGIAVPNLPLNPPPNTGIDLHALGIVGATLMLNEQKITGDGVNSLAGSTNAVHLNLNIAGLITADVTLGHAETSVLCAG
jgi:hypothetical protein